MAEGELPSICDWIKRAKAVLDAEDENEERMPATLTPRLPESLLKFKPEAYATPFLPVEVKPAAQRISEAYLPQVVSFGPYHHLQLPQLMCMENLKIAVCRGLIQRKELNRNLDSIVDKVRDMDSDIIAFYDIQMADLLDDSALALMMTMDALFLLHYLGKKERIRRSYINAAMTPFQMHILRDLVKLENQLPLFVLNAVQKYMTGIDSGSHVIRRAAFDISPFYFAEYTRVDCAVGDKHLLDCLHRYVAGFLEIQTLEKGEKIESVIWSKIKLIAAVVMSVLALPVYVLPLFLVACISAGLRSSARLAIYGSRLPRVCSASELYRRGVCFRALPTDSDRVSFVSGVLYLPTVMMEEDTTEVVLRNLMALEASDLHDEKRVVAAYVDLMNALIANSDDVAILRRCGIVHTLRGSLSDEQIANTWKSLNRPFCGGYLEPPEHLARRMLLTPKRNTFLRFWWEEFQGRFPWLLVFLVGGILAELVAVRAFFGQNAES